MTELFFVLALAVLAIACLMEALKSIIEAVGNKVAKRAIDVPAFVWWILGAVLATLAVVLSLRLIRADLADPAPMVVVVTDPWAAFLWTPIAWWLQMQLDMKIIKVWVLPRLQKVIDKKVEGL